MLRPPVFLACLALFISAAAGCGGSDLVLPGDGTPAQLNITRGNNQPGAPNSTLTDSLEVQVLDGSGVPLPGLTVTFALDSEAPGAEVTPPSATTRTNGTARALWLVGATSGTQRVVARVAREGAEPLEARFIANVGTSTASQIAVADGNEQSGPAGGALNNPLIVLVTDAFGNPVGGVEVQWEAQAGSIDPTSSVTGPDGRAGANWTLGTSSGNQQTATASSGDLSGSPVTFTATALPGTPTTVILESGNNQSAAPGNELPSALVVRLVDDAGNGVPNRAVSWVVATGGGSVSAATSTTDQDGRASTRWTLGDAAGQNTLNAVVSGVGVVGFTATATTGGGGGGGGASRLEFRVQPSDTEEGRTMSPPVEVAVVDQAGNPVTDREFPIKLELLDDRGRVRADGTTTTRSGVATFFIRIDREGDYRLRASTDGLPSVDSDRFEVND